MIISCKKCGTKYKVNASTIGEAGRKVRCTKCSNVWTYSADKGVHEVKKEPLTKINISRSLPVVIQYVVPSWFKVIPIVFVFLILITTAFFFQDSLANKSIVIKKIYESVGMKFTDNIIIHQVEITKKDGSSLDINGFLVNQSKERRKVPNVVVRAMDDNNVKIASFVIKSNKAEFDSGEQYPFFKRVENFPENTKLVTLEIQDKMDYFNSANS